MDMFKVSAEEITDVVAELIVRSNISLPPDAVDVLKRAQAQEESNTGKTILNILLENACLAHESRIPICQDTGIDVVFVDIGRDIMIEGDLVEAINRGVAQATVEGYLRASVCDPITRRNTGDNTPAVTHISFTQEEGLDIFVMPKGCGSENMSAIKMLPPSAGLKGVIDLVLDRVRGAGPNSCPPGVIGIGIGGTMEKACLLSKKALVRPLGMKNPDPELAKLEEEILEEINRQGVGPQGLGGSVTSLAVAIEAYPCHIASLPAAVNIQCHAARRACARFEAGHWIKEPAGDIASVYSWCRDRGTELLKEAKPLSLPLKQEEVRSLRAGQWVSLSGRLLTGRDQTHKRLCQLLERGHPLPVDLKNQLIYYVGPSPAPPGHVIGAAGPTTSYRMDAYTPAILEQGVLGLMGKGRRSAEVRNSIKDHGAVYLATIGGAGAYLARSIIDSRIVAFEELGPEAMYELEVRDFPAIVINDSLGNDYYRMVEGGRS